ncbi:hypothetical protein [Iningainema tapete]|uniref:Glycosyl hydrolase family 98 putative carbohydrate-binding module domain-containing protein n=1 Tax=Iningainema tapete BLCC-T55 TaxID=2748662 RepID=A0A8J6XV41_9CYAN|nr:hypothetical protein [Iningainema tapete]MBD2778311.1 hypothetical protein [Iningainema tapete BLCC-T55]
MQKIKLISSFVASTVVLCVTTAFSETIAQAPPKVPRPVPLLRAKCVSSGLGTAREQNLDVSIGRAVYSSQFYLGPGYRAASLTCKIKPDNRPQPVFQTLNLGFGMRDNDTRSPAVQVRVYLDGRQADARTVAPAQQALISLDVSNVSNVGIEAVCTSQTQYCDRVYFFNTDLNLPPIVSPQPAPQRKN